MGTKQFTERWLPIVGYEGLYEVSDMGSIRSIDRIIPWPLGTVSNRRGTLIKQRKISTDGYFVVTLSKCGIRKHELVSRLVARAFIGEIGSLSIDHINGIVSDNRLVNLRLATRSQNMHNRPKPSNNTSGHKGVVKNHNGWQARITVNGRIKILGTYRTVDEAGAVYAKASEQMVGEFSHS